MNCRRAQRWILGGGATGRIERSVREHTKRCAACRLAAERNERLLNLLTLKRFEYPDVGLEERLLEHLHGVFAADSRAVARSRTGESAGWSPAPARWRYALAGVLLLLLGIDQALFRPSRTAPAGNTGSPSVAGVPDRMPAGRGADVSPPPLVSLFPRNMADPWVLVPRTAPTNTVHQTPAVFIQHEP
jgi:hypothetical protein